MCKLENNITFADYTSYLNDIHSRHCSETGKWIVSDPQFKSWLDGNSNEPTQRLLWLTGIPGSGRLSVTIESVARQLNKLYIIGKTFLCYSILHYLQEISQTGGSNCVLHAFPNYDDASGNTHAAITGSLVYQFCKANPCLLSAANKEYDAISRLGLPVLDPWGKLLEKFICGSEPVYIILDGLDECDVSQRKQLLVTIQSLCNNCPNLYVLVASRKEVDITQKLRKSCEVVIMEEKNRADIEHFVTGEIKALWSRIKDIVEPGTSDIFKDIARNIVVRSEGTNLYCKEGYYDRN
jgi:hypothetical protein